MSFQPRNTGHAIVECVFTVRLDRALMRSELEAVSKQLSDWPELPRMEFPDAFVVAFGSGMPPSMPDPSGELTFSAMKRDGSLDWRLQLKNETIAVNCLSYTRWEAVSSRACGYLRKVVGLLPSTHPVQVLATALNVIDVFDWRGDPAMYDAKELFDEASGLVPVRVFSRGSVWHVHQGWFEECSLGWGERTLNQLKLESLLDMEQKPIIKVDHALELRHEGPLQVSKFVDSDAKYLEQAFWEAHTGNKRVLCDLLTAIAKERISLDGPNDATDR